MLNADRYFEQMRRGKEDAKFNPSAKETQNLERVSGALSFLKIPQLLSLHVILLSCRMLSSLACGFPGICAPKWLEEHFPLPFCN